MKGSLFVSSVQSELAAERRTVRDFVRGDATLGRFFEPFLCEDLPANERRSDETYLDEVSRAAVYVALLGDEYGNGDGAGLSPTEREFERAGELGTPRLIFVKGAPDRSRHPRMRALIDRAGAQLVRHRFTDLPDLAVTLRAGLVEHLLRSGAIATPPFDAAACPDVRIADLSDDKLRWFLETARRERAHPLDQGAPVEVALTHLNLLDSGAPSRAAVLLFGREPQRFVPGSDLVCVHLEGKVAVEPAPAAETCKGTSFDLVDRAVAFVMARAGAAAGANARPGLPRAAVAEAIVNAVAHRDYSVEASVRVLLFADRLEVRSPGALPAGLAPAALARPHASIPRNPLLAVPLYLARYAERPGTGTLDMLAHCRAAGLREPEFRQDGDEFVATLWRGARGRTAPGRAARGAARTRKRARKQAPKRARKGPGKKRAAKPATKRGRPAPAPKRRKKPARPARKKRPGKR